MTPCLAANSARSSRVSPLLLWLPRLRLPPRGSMGHHRAGSRSGAPLMGIADGAIVDGPTVDGLGAGHGARPGRAARAQLVARQHLAVLGGERRERGRRGIDLARLAIHPVERLEALVGEASVELPELEVRGRLGELAEVLALGFEVDRDAEARRIRVQRGLVCDGGELSWRGAAVDDGAGGVVLGDIASGGERDGRAA